MLDQSIAQRIFSEVESGSLDDAMELINLYSDQVLDSEQLTKLLMIAHQREHLNFAKKLLELPLVQMLKPKNYLDILTCVVLNGNQQLLEQLLSLPIVRTAVKGNDLFVKVAAYLNHTNQVAMLKSACDISFEDNDAFLSEDNFPEVILSTSAVLGGEKILDLDLFKDLLLPAYLQQNTFLASKLLELPVAQSLTTIEYLDLLLYVVAGSHQQPLEQLLHVPAIKAVVHEQDNIVLKMAILAGHADQVSTILTIPEVRMTSQNISYDDMLTVILNGNADVALHLLDLESIRAVADRNDNDLLYKAIQLDQVAVVEKLLTIPSVANKVNLYEYYVLNWAIQQGHLQIVKQIFAIPFVKEMVDILQLFMLAKSSGQHEVLKLLITYPWVQQLLMQTGGDRLLSFIQNFISDFPDILDNVRIHGMPYSRLKNLINRDELEQYVNNPIPFLQALNMPADVIEAVSIIVSESYVEEFRQRQAKEDLEREGHLNVDDEKRIGAVKRHFQSIIKPHFKMKFEQYGNNDEERIANIEKSIRAFLLDSIKQEAAEQGNDPISVAVLSFIDSISKEDMSKLLLGTDATLMDEARRVFSSTKSEAQTAWRAYDAWAPVKGDWPNLLTAPLAEDNKKLFTVAAVGLEGPTTKMASDLSREMVAYSFLLVCDLQDGDKSTLATRQQNFIAKIAEIRRAHNEDPTQMDDPSCLPGTISRAGDMWLAHAKAVMVKEEELIAEELRSIVLAEFQKLESDRQNEVYHALVMLSQCNAEEVIDGKISISKTDLKNRAGFIARFNDISLIYKAINESLLARGVNSINESTFMTFCNNMLIDIGGSWIASQLTAAYLRSQKAESQNPYQYFLDTQKPNMTMHNAIMLLRKALASIEIEGKIGFIMKLANYIATGNLELALAELASKGNNIVCDVAAAVTEYATEQMRVTKQKAELWDILHSQFEEDSLTVRDEALREMIHKVIDEKQPLEAVLADNQLVVNNVFLTQHAQHQSSSVKNLKRRQELTSSSDEKRARVG